MSKLNFRNKEVTGLFVNEPYNEPGKRNVYVCKEDIKTKQISDGWHSFADLYTHRMILTLALAKAHPDKVVKSKLHADNTMFDDSFIVYFNTPKGGYSYHYDLKYWDLFKDVKTVPNAPKYDGHKPEDIDRLLSL